MPAPTAQSIEQFLTQSFLAQGFTKKSFVDGAPLNDPTQLPDDTKKLIKAIAVGLAGQWNAWQGSTTVLIPTTSTPGSPSIGVGPWVGGIAPTPNGAPGIPRLTPPIPGGLI